MELPTTRAPKHLPLFRLGFVDLPWLAFPEGQKRPCPRPPPTPGGIRCTACLRWGHSTRSALSPEAPCAVRSSSGLQAARSLGIARASPSGLTAASPPLQDSAPCPPAAPGNHPASPVLGGSQAACDASCTWNRGIARCLSCYLLAASFGQFSGPWCWLRLVEWTSGVAAQRGSRRLTVA